MAKKIFILIVILAIVGVATIPIWTKIMADRAFEKPGRQSTKKIKQALLVQMRINNHKGARLIAEKAILYFPESKELPSFVYDAAICAEHESKPDVAIYWYQYFVDRFPKHEWHTQASNKLKVLKGLYLNE